MIEITDSPDTKQWGEFVLNHTHGNIFQTPEMAEVYRRTKNYEPVTLAAISDTGEMLAVLQAVVIKEMSGFLGTFSARAIIPGGPLFVETETGIKALKLLMANYDKIAQKKALYTQIRTMWDTSNISGFLDTLGYEYEERLNFLITLNRPEEEIWRDIHKSRRRYINKAKREGITIEEMEDDENIQTFYGLLHETYRNAKIPLADISYFKSIFELLYPKGMAKFFFVRYVCDYIAGRLILLYKGVIYGLYVGVARKYLSKNANAVLVWHVINFGSKNGFHTFDFGGAGKPNEEYGVRDFKRKFGGEMVNFGRYEKVYSPAKMKIAEEGFKVYRKINPKLKKVSE